MLKGESAGERLSIGERATGLVGRLPWRFGTAAVRELIVDGLSTQRQESVARSWNGPAVEGAGMAGTVVDDEGTRPVAATWGPFAPTKNHTTTASASDDGDSEEDGPFWEWDETVHEHEHVSTDNELDPEVWDHSVGEVDPLTLLPPDPDPKPKPPVIPIVPEGVAEPVPRGDVDWEEQFREGEFECIDNPDLCDDGAILGGVGTGLGGGQGGTEKVDPNQSDPATGDGENASRPGIVSLPGNDGPSQCETLAALYADAKAAEAGYWEHEGHQAMIDAFQACLFAVGDDFEECYVHHIEDFWVELQGLAAETCELAHELREACSDAGGIQYGSYNISEPGGPVLTTTSCTWDELINVTP